MNFCRIGELLLAALGVVWGFWLVGFGTYDTSPVFEVFRMWHVPQWIMILWPITAGLGLALLPRQQRRPLHRMMCLFWVFITAAVAESNITLTAVPVYATIALQHASHFISANDNC